jgi:hypothetical protein
MYLTFLNRIKFIFILLFFSVCLTNCICNLKKQKWTDVIIDPEISKDLVFRKLDLQEEVFDWNENTDSTMKKTSDVYYFIGKKIDLADEKDSKSNNCRASFYKPDTLLIVFGIGSPNGGAGFGIYYKNKKFYTEPYRFNDIIIVGKRKIEPTYKIVYQKLTLDKPFYKIGDSLYGKIDFKIIEKNKENKKRKIEHIGKGYFRTKVKE